MESQPQNTVRQIMMASLIYFQFDHLNLKLLMFISILQFLKFELLKFRSFEFMIFHPCMQGEAAVV